jgi:uncharacterized protein
MPIRVLSIDGGGMRGVYTASYLNSLERSYARARNASQGLDLGRAFQLIVGTSTGAIVGCGLAKGLLPLRLVELYKKHGKEIFPRRMPAKAGLDLLMQLHTRPALLRRGDAALRKALAEALGSTTVKHVWDQRKVALAIATVNMANYRGWIFKTPHNSKTNHRDDDYTLVDVCCASSAAPLYRSLAVVDQPVGDNFHVFADGGLWANNPVLVALVEALRMSEGSEEDIELFCLGSCGRPEGENIARHAVHRGLAEWKFGGEAAKVSIAAQESAFDEIARMLLPYLKRKVHLVRFPSSKIPGALLQYLDLDETREEGLAALIRQAQQDADMTNSEIQRGTDDGQRIDALFCQAPLATN